MQLSYDAASRGHPATSGDPTTDSMDCFTPDNIGVGATHRHAASRPKLVGGFIGTEPIAAGPSA